MTGSAQYQTQDSRYTKELAEQLERVERAVEGGQSVTVRLVDGDRQVVLAFKDGKVFEASAPGPVPPGQKPPTLADNRGLVPTVQGTYAFDLREAERQIPPQDKTRRLQDAAQLRVDDDKVRARVASGLPLTKISQMGSDDYHLVEDCTYRANDGYTITALNGFKTDLASIPALLTVLVSVRDLSITAPTFHDLIYRTGGQVAPPYGTVSPDGKVFTKDEADDLFLELMTREKVGFFKRNLAYGAVVLAGRRAWRGA